MKKPLVCIIFSIVLAVSSLAGTVSAYQPYTPVYDFGDINNDGNVSSNDALLALQCAVNKISLDYDRQDAADVDQNWQVTAADALLILQHSVNKIVLKQKAHPYGEYALKYVEPTGLTAYKMYQIASGTCLTDQSTEARYDLTRLIVCIQGLINRNNDKHHVAVTLRMDATDDFWLQYMMEDGATYADYEIAGITTTQAMLDTFHDFMKACGLIIWDPNVPSTANVASTICGLYNYLPVQYSTEEKSLYKILTEQYDIPVKMNLTGKFDQAGKGKKIADTNLDSTGSPKNDAYIWAMEKYMGECNPEHLAYTLDGASAVLSNPVAKGRNAYNAKITGIPNHDYFVLNQCFFFDLTSYGLEAPSDELDQPVGTDALTMKKILQKRYDMAGGNFGVIIGFPPWHVKYTNRVDGGTLEPPRLEWQFVEMCGAYNCGIEADAANPCWLSNASLYTKYALRNEPNGNAPAKEIEYDPDTYYYTQCYTGDFDCSPWLKMRVPTVWTDKNLGKIATSYNYSTNLIDRIPMAFDYVYGKQSEYEYLTVGEGTAYVMPSSLFKGFTGKESGSVTRTLPSGDRAYIHYAKPYFDWQKLGISGRVINGYTALGRDDFVLLNHLTPKGSFLQSSAAGGNNLQVLKGIPYIRMGGISGADDEMRRINLRAAIKGAESKFLAFGYSDINDNAGTATSFIAFMEGFEYYLSWRDPAVTYQYVDLETFFALLAKSGKGTIIE